MQSFCEADLNRWLEEWGSDASYLRRRYGEVWAETRESASEDLSHHRAMVTLADPLHCACKNAIENIMSKVERAHREGLESFLAENYVRGVREAVGSGVDFDSAHANVLKTLTAESLPAPYGWLIAATRGLSEEAARKVFDETIDGFRSRVAELVGDNKTPDEASREALSELGDPKMARRQFLRMYLTQRDIRAVWGWTDKRNRRSQLFCSCGMLFVSMCHMYIGHGRNPGLYSLGLVTLIYFGVNTLAVFGLPWIWGRQWDVPHRLLAFGYGLSAASVLGLVTAAWAYIRYQNGTFLGNVLLVLMASSLLFSLLPFRLYAKACRTGLGGTA